MAAKVTPKIIIIWIIFSLGCGGGGGGTSDSPFPANTPPVVDAGMDQALNLAIPQTINLSATASDEDGTVITHQWVQAGGPTLILSGTETPEAYFSAPAKTAAYTFHYTATDDGGAQATDSVSVYVAKIILAESFSDGDGWKTRWAIHDETGNGAAWSVTPDGQLCQLNNASWHAMLNPTSYHLGTFAVLDPSSSGGIPTSYAFSVDITPLPDTTGRQGNDVGIMFRYTDPDNYYRLSMSSRWGFTRLEKRQNGVFQTLAVNAIGYAESQTMTMTAEISGDTTIVWIDGDPVFAVVDPGIASGTIALYCQDSAGFDTILISENNLQPKVAISRPLAFSVALTPDPGDSLSAKAIVFNMPEGGQLEFTLFDPQGGSRTLPGMEAAGVHCADFPGLAVGEYDLIGVLRDAAGVRVNSDINSMVGVGGDYIITLGDSITNGVGDENASNNDSADGRIVGIQGYQAELSDFMTAITNRPQIVFNEGIGGDTSSMLEDRVDSILERHPGANKVLMMIGANDSGSLVPPDIFANNLSAAIGKVSGRHVWLAKTMPIFINDSPVSWTLDAARNTYLLQYNQRIDQLAGDDPAVFLGPDFYTVFYSLSALYADYIHPNDAGYAVMAEQWRVALTP